MKLEPEAVELFEACRSEWLSRGKSVPQDMMQQILLLSQGESLKRIADALWGTEGTTGIVQLLNSIERAARES